MHKGYHSFIEANMPQGLIDMLHVYKDSEMNGQAFAIFNDEIRYWCVMKPNIHSIKYHPIFITDEHTKDNTNSKLKMIEAKDITFEEIDIMFQNSDELLRCANLQNPHLSIKLNQRTIKQIFMHFEKVSNLLQDHIANQSIVLHEKLVKSKQWLLAKSRMMFVIDIDKEDISIYMQNLNDVQVDIRNKTLLTMDTLLSNYQSPPLQIDQSKCINISSYIKLKHSYIRYIKFELDFLDVDILLENGFDTIDIMDAFSTMDTLNADTVILRDYVCFKKPKYIIDRSTKDELDFKCLVLPSYLK
jgi:hypothetical protein